ncbi:integrin alpha-E [Rhynchocyon petersi]
MWLFHALLFMTSLAPMTSFNVDVTQTGVTPKDEPFVLSTLLHQDSSTNQTWLLVTSPRTNEPLLRCSGNETKISCQPVEGFPIPKTRYRGVTVVRNQHGVLICIQVTTRKPHSLNTEFTGTCSLLTSDFKLQFQINFSDLENHLNQDAGCYNNRENSTGWSKNSIRQRRALGEVEEAEEEETGTEIAIVLDGSGSIDPPDFQRAKDFISNMMRDIYEKCFECSFALVQYGDEIRTEFDLQDSQDVMASLARVQNITQVGKVTKTASAIQHVLDSIFIPSRGSRKKATKVMVVLTDGDTFHDPLNLTTVVNSPKMKDIERFSIGVGVFKSDKELKLIASDPDETHVFKVTNYSALDGLLSRLQQRIVHMEGAAGDDLHYQMAQVGFSAQILDERKLLFGAVGAFDWSGGALLYNMSGHQGHQFLKQKAVDDKSVHYSYLGYSLAVLHRANGLSFVAGAPQYKHHGAVFGFKNCTAFPVLEGEQMGSYFGSELCSVDVDMDGMTDILLVAAPFYHNHREEGRVYLYRLNKKDDSFFLASTLHSKSNFTDARFGFAMAAIGDINQDNLTDVAIGAPMEDFGTDDDASFGSVYIYNGRPDGLSTSPSQRIRASQVNQGLHYFGMSLAGGFDFSGDGLTDITVGSLGRAAVLRSRRVIHLKVSMNFSPDLLPVDFNDTVNANLCFETSSKTPVTGDDLRDTALNFTPDLDVMKQRKRLMCLDEKTCVNIFRKWDGSSRLCQDLQFLPTKGEQYEDYYSNITIKVSYKLQTPEAHRSNPYPILDFYEESSAIFQLPYQKSCNNKLFCIPDLKLAVDITQKDLVVGHTKELEMTVTVTNAGEDSYMTELIFKYPRNLQLKRTQEPPLIHIQCEDPTPAASILVMNCKIGYHLFKRSSADILVVWQLEENAFPNRTADIIVLVTRPSVVYVKTGQGLSHDKEFLFNIHGENPFGAQFHLQICVPVKVSGLQILKVERVTMARVLIRGNVTEDHYAIPLQAGQGVVNDVDLQPPSGDGAGLPLERVVELSEAPRTALPTAPHSEFSGMPESIERKRADLSPALVSLPPAAVAFRAAGGDAGSGQPASPGTRESVSGVAERPAPLTCLAGAGAAGRRAQRAARGAALLRGPRSQSQVSRGHNEARLILGNAAADTPAPRTDRAAAEVRVVRVVRHDRLRGAAVAEVVAAAAAKEMLLVLRREPRSGGPPLPPPRTPCSGAPVRSEEPVPGSRGRSRHGSHPPRGSNTNTARLPRDAHAHAAGRPARRVLAPARRVLAPARRVLAPARPPGPSARPARPPNPSARPPNPSARPPGPVLAPARPPNPSARPPGPSARPRVLAPARRILAPARRAGVECLRSQNVFCESQPGQHVEEWYSASCAIVSNKENVTVAAELLASEQLQRRDVSELQILGEVTFDKDLYEGLNKENHKTKITVIYLNDEKYKLLPVIIGSSVGGLLILIVIIVILVKCGFFKRKYQQNLESMRTAQETTKAVLTEEN